MGRSDGYNARGCMWDRLIPELIFMNTSERKQAKRAYADDRRLNPSDFNPMPEDELKAMQLTTSDYVINCTAGTTSAQGYLAPLPAPPIKVIATRLSDWTEHVVYAPPNTPIKKGKKMYDDCDDCLCSTPAKTDEQKKREYLARRVYTTSDVLRTKLAKQFYMDGDAVPTTFQELLDRLTAGKYTVSDENKKKKQYYVGDLFRYLSWRDPAHPADEAGYELASAALDKEQTKVMDTVKVGDVAEALKAVQAFESWTYTA